MMNTATAAMTTPYRWWQQHVGGSSTGGDDVKLK